MHSQADDAQSGSLGLPLVAALPMYDFPELRPAHDEFWNALAERLNTAGVRGVPQHLTRDVGHLYVWRHPSLLFGQGCEYPLAKSFAGAIKLVATPRYSVPGCSGASYRSAILVRKSEPGESLAAFRGRRGAINEMDSNSGMNLLRAAIAPLAGGRAFFGSVVVSGSHRRSAAMVAAGEADLAAVDCVTYAHIQRLYPEEVANLRVLCWTPASPCLPFITSRNSIDSRVRILKGALTDLFVGNAAAGAREALFLDGVDLEPDESFSKVLKLEEQAGQLGYPRIG
jgi:ABC-type phosphate/phosphonate transport system substrate-binding protein